MSNARQRRAHWLAAIILSIYASLSGGVGTGGTGLAALYVGAVAPGPGIAVNGTTFDTTEATITINGVRGRHADDLQPGMVARISGRVVAGTGSGKADAIDVSRVVRARLMTVGTGGTGLLDASLSVATQADTVLSGFGALADLAPGAMLDVYGYVDALTRTVHASRIELAVEQPEIEIRGIVTMATATTLSVDGLVVDIAGASLSGFAGAPQVGDRVVVRGTSAAGGIVAGTVDAEAGSTLRNGELGEIEGAVVALNGQGSFFVDDIEVDAAHATVTNGTLGDVAVGRVIHVSGTVVNNVLVARAIELDDLETADVDGPITSFASVASFVVGGRTIDASAAQISGGGVADLRVGREVAVIGHNAGKVLIASRVVLSRNGSVAEVEGRVGSIVGPGRFVVGGTSIDARSARVRGAPLAVLRIGSRVHAVGSWNGGVFVARDVEIEP